MNNSQVWAANRAFLDTELYNISKANGWLFPGISPEFFLGPALNLSIPEAYQYFKRRMSVFPDLGVKGYKIDRGEEGEMPGKSPGPLPCTERKSNDSQCTSRTSKPHCSTNFATRRWLRNGVKVSRMTSRETQSIGPDPRLRFGMATHIVTTPVSLGRSLAESVLAL